MNLIVINARSGGSTARLFWGSVAEKVASAAPVPVFVFHPQSTEGATV